MARAAWMVALCLRITNAAPQITSGPSFEAYRYELTSGKGVSVCLHMSQIFNATFRRPWDYDTYNFPPPWFPPRYQPGTEPKVRFGLFSRYPSSPEFEAIKWEEDVLIYSGSPGTGTALISRFDIDNDGTADDVLKVPQMNPGGGGFDDVVVFDSGHFDGVSPIDGMELNVRPGERRPAVISSQTLGIEVPWIRPFLFEGINYLAAIEGVDNRAGPMLVLQYKSGGGYLGNGRRVPLEVQTTCRFDMLIDTKRKDGRRDSPKHIGQRAAAELRR